MANLYRPRTIALAKMAALPKYRHPADLANEYQRPVSQQLSAINGEFEFGKGLYINDRYEKLVSSVLPLRKSFRSAVRAAERVAIAKQEADHWENYVRQGVEELPKDKKIDDKKRSQLFEGYTVAKERTEDRIACHRMLIFHNEYSKAFGMDVEVHPRILAKMVHPHFGYMLFFRRNLTLDELVEFYHRMLFASEARYDGQTLHSDELTAHTFWWLFNAGSHLNLTRFCELLRCFKFGVTPQKFTRDFAYSLRKAPQQLSSDIAQEDQVMRFDFFRQIFLQRGL